ncbi:MAG: hypothetical protein U9Q83_07805, partial [Bacteroidota bacterium]|nr:hypothetical protein [Bacteroidota bacterium]
EAIKNRKIVLYPDLGLNINKKGTPFDQWQQKAKLLNKAGFKITISNLLERTATTSQRQKGEDIADFVIRELKNKKSQKTEIKLSKEQVNFNKLAKINPNLVKFIEVFGLKMV